MTLPRTGLWRHFDRLPLTSPQSIVSLGEGDTPLLDLTSSLGVELGLSKLVVKAEDRNPTGSFKARIATVAHSIVRERGLTGVIGTSSGNGGAAAAAYAAAAGTQALIFTLNDIIAVKLREIHALGARVIRVDGVGHRATETRTVADLVARVCQDQGFYPMLTGFHYAPEAMAGVKTLAYELAEDVPDLTHVYLPVGGGGLLTGVYLGYAESDGVDLPHLVGVQPAGGALHRALIGHPEGIAGRLRTRISGLQMASLYDAEGAMEAIRMSSGHVTEVPDEEIWAAQEILARSHGLLVEPAGAAALAGLLSDVREGKIPADARVAVVLTGAGYKDTDSLERLAGDDRPSMITPSELPAAVEMALKGIR